MAALTRISPIGVGSVTTGVGNVGTGEDDLQTLTIPANTLTKTGDFLEFWMIGGTAANANNKTLKIRLNSQILIDTGAVVQNNKDWVARGVVVRTGTTTGRAGLTLEFENATTYLNYLNVSLTSLDWTADQTFKATGEATSNDDIYQNLLIVTAFNQ